MDNRVTDEQVDAACELVWPGTIFLKTEEQWLLMRRVLEQFAASAPAPVSEAEGEAYCWFMDAPDGSNSAGPFETEEQGLSWAKMSAARAPHYADYNPDYGRWKPRPLYREEAMKAAIILALLLTGCASPQAVIGAAYLYSQSKAYTPQREPRAALPDTKTKE